MCIRSVPRVAGQVMEVWVDDNQMVKSGDLLVKLDTRDNEVALQRAQANLDQSNAQVLQAQAAIVQARAAYDQAQAQVTQARAQTTQAGAQYEVAGINYGRNKSLSSKDSRAVSQSDVDTTKSSLDAQRGAFDAAKASVQAAEASAEASKSMIQSREAELAVAKAGVETNQANVDDAKLQLSYCWVLAPCDGRVSRKTVETGLRVSAGPAAAGRHGKRRVGAGKPQGNPIGEGPRRAAGNDPVDAFKKHPFTGRVDSIQAGSGATFSLLPPDNATGNFTKIVQRVPVKIIFDRDNSDTSIKGFEDLVGGRAFGGAGDRPRQHQRTRRPCGQGSTRAAQGFASDMSCKRACRRWWAGGAVLVASWLAGCAVGPNYSGPPKPETPDPARYKNADAYGRWKRAQPADNDPRGPWWVVFHDPDLTRLETAAVANNQDLRQSVARIEESRAQTRVVAADFFPNAEFNGSAIRQRTSNTEPEQRGMTVGGLGSLAGGGAGGMTGGAASGGSSSLTLTQQPLTRTYNLFHVPADLNWEIDIFGRVRRSYEAARATLQAQEADAQNVRLSVTANVATGYYNLRALDAEIGVLDDTIKFRKDALFIANERLQAGLSSELDVQREKSELAGNEADRAGVERTRAEMENALATLVGQPASSFRMARRTLVGVKPPRIPAGVPSQLLERRPDVAEAERNLAAANARIGVAVAAFFPRVNLTGAAGFESASVGQLFNWESTIWQIGPNVQLPIFEGGRNVANLRAARAQYNEGVARYRGQVLVAFQDVESALSDLRTLAVQAAAQDRAVAAARRTLELSNDQYKKGAVTFLDVVDAERSVLSSERSAAQLLGQRMQATVQLIKSLGGGWS